MVNRNSSDFAIVQYLSAHYFGANGYLFCLFFVVAKNSVVQCRLNCKVVFLFGPPCHSQ